MRPAHSARNQLTTAVKSARANSTATTSANTTAPAQLSNNDPLTTAAVRAHLRDALFVDADNLERLVMYFRRLGTKAAETKLRDLRSIYGVIGQLSMSNQHTGVFFQCKARQ
ncbi:hypothetical protein MIR68_009318 [Amoeboaphelidium protococcarum]|nr:hypothetical protein MIR68_009318 [Amoeboaphelidium protococcarum]